MDEQKLSFNAQNMYNLSYNTNKAAGVIRDIERRIQEAAKRGEFRVVDKGFNDDELETIRSHFEKLGFFVEYSSEYLIGPTIAFDVAVSISWANSGVIKK